jgi:hypothetical protein
MMERSVASLGENDKLRKLVVGGSRGWNEGCLIFPNNSHLSMTLVNGVGCPRTQCQSQNGHRGGRSSPRAAGVVNAR